MEGVLKYELNSSAESDRLNDNLSEISWYMCDLLSLKLHIDNQDNKEKYFLKYKFVYDNIWRIFNHIYVIDFKGNVGFLPGHSVTTTGWIPKLPKFFHEINIYILKKKK